ANLLWGAPRIHGELLKLDLDGAERTVSRLMPKRRLPPSQTWRTFLANHVRNLVLIDFLVVPSAPLRVLFVLVVLAHHRRPVPIASGRTGSRLVMTRCTRTLQRTNGRHLGTRRTDGGAVGRRPLDGAALSDMAKDRVGSWRFPKSVACITATSARRRSLAPAVLTTIEHASQVQLSRPARPLPVLHRDSSVTVQG